MAYNENREVGGLVYKNAPSCNVTQYKDYKNTCNVTSYGNYKDNYYNYKDSHSESYTCSNHCYQGSYYTDHRPCYTSTYDDSHSESYTCSNKNSCSTSYSCSVTPYRDCTNVCSVTPYLNVNNQCVTEQNYTNTLTNKGVPISLNWSSLNWNGNSFNKETLSDSISAMKELRDNVRRLSLEKGTNTVSDSNVKPDSGLSRDGVLESGKAVFSNFNAIRDTLEALFSQLKNSSSTVPSVSQGDIIDKKDINKLKEKISELADAGTSEVFYNNVVSAYLNYKETRGI